MKVDPSDAPETIETPTTAESSPEPQTEPEAETPPKSVGDKGVDGTPEVHSPQVQPTEPKAVKEESETTNKPAEEIKSEAEPEPSKASEESAEAQETTPEPSAKEKELTEKLYDSMVKAASVPEEIIGLLPKDINELETYLASDSYKSLKAKVSSQVVAPAVTAPEPPKKSSKPNSFEAVGIALVG